MTDRTWGSLVLRGLFAIIIGVIAILWPGITLEVLVILFALFALLDGALAFVAAVETDWWPFILSGVISVLIGLAIFIWPAPALLIIIYVIAIWAVITGIFQIVGGIAMRKQVSGEWMMILSGIASLILGSILVIFPLLGTLAYIWVFGIYAVIFGVLMVGSAFQLKGAASK
ncbi:MAG: HdeD family acid-resistance protein [Candidatus Saganbacteria bacterium]|nr:HdeD family acid-resistance protein [Candidatus Saganbacteria bacterium]